MPGAENQQTITDWQRETFGPPADPGVVVHRALEEVVELCRLLAPTEQEQQIVDRLCGVVHHLRGNLSFGKASEELLGKAGFELADVFIVLYGAAGFAGIDLQKAIDEKMAVNRARTWRTDEAGRGYHV